MTDLINPSCSICRNFDEAIRKLQKVLNIAESLFHKEHGMVQQLKRDLDSAHRYFQEHLEEKHTNPAIEEQVV